MFAQVLVLSGVRANAKEVTLVLVLSRKRDEEIIINPGANEIVITIVDIRGDKVRIGIDAPKEIPVHRREVLSAIIAEQSPT